MRAVVCVSDSDKHFASAIWEYEKRLTGKLKIENIKPAKHWTQKQIIEKDTISIISLLSKKYKDYHKIYLSKEWKSFTTETFSNLLKKHLDVLLVIWWPYGLNEEKILPYIDLKISFGWMTLQHGLSKLVLLEQLYRVSTIWEGRQYHY